MDVVPTAKTGALYPRDTILAESPTDQVAERKATADLMAELLAYARIDLSPMHYEVLYNHVYNGMPIAQAARLAGYKSDKVLSGTLIKYIRIMHQLWQADLLTISRRYHLDAVMRLHDISLRGKGMAAVAASRTLLEMSGMLGNKQAPLLDEVERIITTSTEGANTRGEQFLDELSKKLHKALADA